jgi:hypothetical protein
MRCAICPRRGNDSAYQRSEPIALNWIGATEIEATIDVRDAPASAATNLMGQL